MPGAEPPRRPSFRRLSSDRRREEIITAAVTLFGDRPAAEVSIDDVAAAAGTSRSSVYRYFDGEGELYEAAVQRVGAELVARLDGVAEWPPSVGLLERLRLYMDFLEEYSGGYVQFLGGGAARAPDAALAAAQHVRDRIAGMTYRVLQVEEPGPVLRTTVQAWIAGVEWTGIRWLRTGEPDRPTLEALLSTQLAVMLAGAATQDEAVAERVAWLMEVEPPDSAFGAMVRMVAGAFDRRSLAGLAKFLAFEESAPA
ncbi:TetR/AcrR family transcriptional regulator [Spirillospora sp. NPDC050679]